MGSARSGAQELVGLEALAWQQTHWVKQNCVHLLCQCAVPVCNHIMTQEGLWMGVC